jgi:purine-binding chemotaxis protein CheW
MQPNKAAAEHTQYLGLFIAGEEYGIGVLRVKEILQYETITRVHGAAASVRGVINVRGNVVPVIDLAIKFGMPETQITGRTCIVVVEADVEGEPLTLGVLAEAVTQVVDLADDDIRPAPSFGTRVHVKYLLGMAPSGKKFILLLDIDKVLSAEDAEAVRATAAPEISSAELQAVEPEPAAAAPDR